MRRLGIVVVLFAIAACSQPAGPPPAAPTVVVTSVSAAPSPTEAGCDRGTADGGSGPVREVMIAWLNCDNDRLRALQTDEALAALDAAPTSRAKWTFAHCDGAAGSSYCRYRDEIGTDMIFRLRNEPVARPAIEFRLEGTVYDKSAEKYTRNFVDAWINGNRPRMTALGTPAVVAFADGHDAPSPGYSIVLSPSEVWIFEVTNAAGRGYRFVLQGTLGKGNAITTLVAL